METKISSDILIGSEDIYKYWENKYTQAIAYMKSKKHFAPIFIEIAAQHPLESRITPNAEFTARLLVGRDLYMRETARGAKVKIYVPGSRHTHNRVNDLVSLSEAGKTFLVTKNIPAEDVHGEDLNVEYKPYDGVYNSADECFVAASHFKKYNFGTLISVCSPQQMLRKTIHYLEFGVIPMNHTVPVESSHHNYLYEIFNAIPYALFVDPDMQADGSTKAKSIRSERKPLD